MRNSPRMLSFYGHTYYRTDYARISYDKRHPYEPTSIRTYEHPSVLRVANEESGLFVVLNTIVICNSPAVVWVIGLAPLTVGTPMPDWNAKWTTLKESAMLTLRTPPDVRVNNAFYERETYNENR